MTKRFMTAAVFLVGCAAGSVSSQLVVPKASAQQAAALTKWEYLCGGRVDYDEWQAFVTRAGGQGWELTTAQIDMGYVYPCFKRPKV